MAIFIGIFMILGLEPGPKMMTVNLDLVYFVALVIALTSVAASILGLAIASTIAKAAYVQPAILVPILISVSFVGSFIETRTMTGVTVALIAGLIGYWLKLLNYSNAGVTLGFVMGTMVEKYLFLSLQAYGPTFFLRPITLAIAAMGIMVVLGPYIKQWFHSKGSEMHKSNNEE
jgi:TctA family transporter